MISAQLFAVGASIVFPLVAEIDCRPLAARTGTAYKVEQIMVESFDGKKAVTFLSVGEGADLGDVAQGIFLALNATGKVSARLTGTTVTVTDVGGSPLQKVTFKFADGGPKPAVRYVPKRLSR